VHRDADGQNPRTEHWEVIASLIETCKLIGVEPQYLTDIATKIVKGHLNSKIDDLLPWTYATKSSLLALA
jgi:transposase